MNETYIKYGLIAAGVIVVIYALMRGGSQSAQSDGGALAVDVQYSPTFDPSASIAARAQAFSELAGLVGLTISEESAQAQAREANETAREIARRDTELGRYALDVGAQVEGLRVRGARELAEFQAGQVNYLAESFRNKGVDRLSANLNALTSIWGNPPTYAPERKSNTADIINAIAGGASKFFSFGLG